MARTRHPTLTVNTYLSFRGRGILSSSILDRSESLQISNYWFFLLVPPFSVSFSLSSSSCCWLVDLRHEKMEGLSGILCASSTTWFFKCCLKMLRSLFENVLLLGSVVPSRSDDDGARSSIMALMMNPVMTNCTANTLTTALQFNRLDIGSDSRTPSNK